MTQSREKELLDEIANLTLLSDSQLANQERLADELIEKILERARDCRDMAGVERDADCWNAAYGSDGKASGLFVAVRMIRKHMADVLLAKDTPTEPKSAPEESNDVLE